MQRGAQQRGAQANASKRKQTRANADKRKQTQTRKRKQTQANASKRGQTQTKAYTPLCCGFFFYTRLCNPLKNRTPAVAVAISSALCKIAQFSRPQDALRDFSAIGNC